MSRDGRCVSGAVSASVSEPLLLVGAAVKRGQNVLIREDGRKCPLVYGPTRIQRPSEGIRPLVMTKSKYGPGGAMVESGGASTWRDVAPPPVIVHPMKRCDILNPCVTAPGRSSTTSAINGASGELTVKVSP